MKITNGDASRTSENEIYDALEAALLAADPEADTSDGSIYDAILSAHASYIFENIESDLVDAFDSGFLDFASSDVLDNLVEVVGIERLDAVAATGIETFKHGSPTDQTYSIPSGTTVQTSGTPAQTYDTIHAAEIPLWDDFESWDGTAYSGDVASFQQDTTTFYEGAASLHSPDGSSGTITKDGSVSRIEQTHTFRAYLESGGTSTPAEIGINMSHYPTGAVWRVDADNNDIQANGTIESHTVPFDEWLYCEVYIYQDGDSEIYVENAAGTEIATVTDTFSGDPTELTPTAEVSIQANGGPSYIDILAATDVSAAIRANETGTAGNLAAGKIDSLSTSVSGVNSVTNPYSIGDTDLFTVQVERFTAGADEESDDELRERVRDVTGDGGAATIDSLIGSCLAVDNVRSVSLFENDTDTDNTGSGGLPPVSFELVVDGGTDADVAEAIFDEKAATARDYGGANGTDTTSDVTAVNDQTFTIHFSRPSTLNVDATLDLVVTDEYEGDRAVRSAVVEYIGGTGVDGDSVLGTEVGEDVVVNEVEARVMDVAGVKGVDSSGSSYTPTTTTDANGLEVVDVGANEVAQTDGSDGSISITKTTI